jgi:hypothetical protein
MPFLFCLFLLSLARCPLPSPLLPALVCTNSRAGAAPLQRTAMMAVMVAMLHMVVTPVTHGSVVAWEGSLGAHVMFSAGGAVETGPQPNATLVPPSAPAVAVAVAVADSSSSSSSTDVRGNASDDPWEVRPSGGASVAKEASSLPTPAPTRPDADASGPGTAADILVVVSKVKGSGASGAVASLAARPVALDVVVTAPPGAAVNAAVPSTVVTSRAGGFCVPRRPPTTPCPHTCRLVHMQTRPPSQHNCFSSCGLRCRCWFLTCTLLLLPPPPPPLASPRALAQLVGRAACSPLLATMRLCWTRRHSLTQWRHRWTPPRSWLV